MDAIEALTALNTAEGKADPYPLYAALHELGEAADLGPGGVLVYGYDALSTVLRDPAFRHPGVTGFDVGIPGWREHPSLSQGAEWILYSNAPEHTRIRNLIARVFTARRVAGLEPAIARMTDRSNRDPRRFADPGTFDPMRSEGGPLSFGGGAHFCLGAALARLEAAVAFPRILARFPALAAAGEPQRRQTLVLRGFDTLPVTVA